MKTSDIKGIIPPVITPMNNDPEQTVNHQALREQVERLLAGGVHGIFPMGTNGEAYALSFQEKEEILATVIDQVKGRVPVYAGTGCITTAETIRLSKRAEELGADALLVITPYYNKPNRSGMMEHFCTIADNVDIPVYIYNVPARTGICIDPETVEALSKHRNIAGMKEASGDMSYFAKISALTGDDFALYSGNDDITVALMSMGAVGVVSVWANLMPDKVREMTHAFLDGDTEKARKMQLRYLNLINALFCETNPLPIKTIMNMKGMDVGSCRLPLGPVSSASRRVLRRLADEM